jgi:hypothetical protein
MLDIYLQKATLATLAEVERQLSDFFGREIIKKGLNVAKSLNFWFFFSFFKQNFKDIIFFRKKFLKKVIFSDFYFTLTYKNFYNTLKIKSLNCRWDVAGPRWMSLKSLFEIIIIIK